MKNWKKLALSSAALLSAVTLVACSSSDKTASTPAKAPASGGDVTLKLWIPTGSTKSYADTIAAFEKENKGVKVTFVESEDPKAQENITKDPEAAADVFSMPHDQLGSLVEVGILQPVSDTYAKEVADNNVANAVTGAQYKGKTYAFPFGVESQVLLYNKDQLTPEDVKTYEGITAKGKFGANFESVNAYAVAPLMLSVGNTLFGENGEDAKGTKWANDNGMAVMNWLAAQKSNKGFVNVPDDSVVSKFGNGDVSAIQTGPWNYPDSVKVLGKEKIGVTVYPKVKIGGKEVQQKAFMGVKLYAVNQKPAKGNKDRIIAAYKLASFLTSEKSQENQFKTRSIVPSNKKVQASEAVTSDPLAKAVATMTGSSEYTVVMPKISQMSTFWNSAAPLLSGPYSGKVAQSDYMAKLQQFDKDLAESK